MVSSPSEKQLDSVENLTALADTALQEKVVALETKNQMLSDKVKQMLLIEHQLYASQGKLDSQVRVYRKLYALGKSLNQTFHLPDVLELAIHFVLYELEFERCLILLFDSARSSFEVKAFDGYYDELTKAAAASLSIPVDATLLQNIISSKDRDTQDRDVAGRGVDDCEMGDYEIYAAPDGEVWLRDWRAPLGMDEYIVFSLSHESGQKTHLQTLQDPTAEVPLGLLIAGNSVERLDFHTRVKAESEGFLGLANAASQITTAIKSVNFYQALNAERSLLEKRVQERTQALHDKNESLQATLKELNQAQAQLVQSEKMSGLGQLVAGIAHEINNPVSFIYGNLEYARDYTQDLLALVKTYQTHYPEPHGAVQKVEKEIEFDFLKEDLPRLMSSMQIGATRIEKIVLSLRTFSRTDESDLKWVDVHDGIDSTLLILDHKLNGKLGDAPITVIKNYGELPLVECYAGQLNQVFMNILANAVDALKEAAGREAQQNDHSHNAPQQSELSQDEPGQNEPSQIEILTAAADGAVTVTISDNGPGIPEEIRGNIFNPFFTTKPVGQGTGMGLSISYQIVCDRHKGSLACESAEGQGTRFVIKIPTSLSSALSA